MADRSDSERLGGFCYRWTDGRTFAILESLSRLKRGWSDFFTDVSKALSSLVILTTAMKA